jgi:hypothetical protein
MTGPAPRRRVDVEDMAIPKWNLIDDFVEALGLAGAALLPSEPIDAGPARRAAPVRRREPAPAEPERGLPLVLRYPRIDDDGPLGPNPANPMGEGSEETALPVIDPVDVRLGQVRSAPDPMP